MNNTTLKSLIFDLKISEMKPGNKNSFDKRTPGNGVRKETRSEYRNPWPRPIWKYCKFTDLNLEILNSHSAFHARRTRAGRNKFEYRIT